MPAAKGVMDTPKSALGSVAASIVAMLVMLVIATASGIALIMMMDRKSENIEW